MNKPVSYDEVSVGGFSPINLGGHTCVIKQVSEAKSKNGDDMIVVLFDFDDADDQSGYFKTDFDRNTREGKKWPFNGTCWIMVNDYKDKARVSKNFKGFITNVEESNPGFKIAWGSAAWGKQFVGKKIGAVYGNEEDEYNGEYRMRPRLKWFCQYGAAKGAKIPEAKYIQNKPVAAAPAPASEPDDDLPF